MRLAYLYVWWCGAWQFVTYGPCEDGYVEHLKNLRRMYQTLGLCTAIVRKEFRFIKSGEANALGS